MNKKNNLIEDYKRESKKKYKIKALSFFSGAMGLDIGLEKEGIHPLLACENDPASRKTIFTNKGKDIGLIGDLNDYNPKHILEFAGLKKNEKIDVIVGGPPCQAFSTAGKRRGFTDLRGNVFLKYIDTIIALKPTYAVIENVRGLLSLPILHIPHSLRGNNKDNHHPETLKGSALKLILDKLKKGGYNYSFNLYNSANFGSPQIRERVIIIATRNKNAVNYLEPTHSEIKEYKLHKWKTLGEAIKGLGNIKHTHVNFSNNRTQYYKLLKEGQNWRDLPKNLQKKAMGNSFFAGGGKTGFYRRVDRKKPSPTLVTHPAMPATDLCHPTEIRPLSVEEYKKIQGFPNEWIICGNMIDMYKQIGNAVPVELGGAVGKAIIKHMNKKKVNEIKNFPYSRYKKNDEESWLKSFKESKKIQLELNI